MKSGFSAAISLAAAAVWVYLSEVFGGNTSSENVTPSRANRSDIRMFTRLLVCGDTFLW